MRASKCGIARDDTLFLVDRHDVIHAWSEKKPRRKWGVRQPGPNPGPGEFTTVSSIGVSDCHVYVCDYLNDRVQIFRHDGSWVNMVSGMFQYPEQVGVLAQRRQIMVRDQAEKTLQCFSFAGVWERNINLSFWPGTFALSRDEIFVQEDERFMQEDELSLHVFGFEGEWLRHFALRGHLIASTVTDFLWISRTPVGNDENDENQTVALALDGREIVQFIYPDVKCIAVGPCKSLLLSNRGNIVSPALLDQRQRDCFNTRLCVDD